MEGGARAFFAGALKASGKRARTQGTQSGTSKGIEGNADFLFRKLNIVVIVLYSDVCGFAQFTRN